VSIINVFTAKAIYTMEPSAPQATAIAVRDGQIIEVGSLESMKPWLSRYQHEIDTRFEDKIILPGFIDPHLHPSMAAVILPMHFITAMRWDLPWERVEPTTTPETYLARVAERAHAAPEDVFFTWGYHRNWHGEITRHKLDELKIQKPIIVWHRSFHEIIMNSAAIEHFSLDENSVSGHPQIDIDKGAFFENGLHIAIKALNPILMSPEHFGVGMQRLKEVVHFGGHTLIGDMGIGIFNFDMEWQSALEIFDKDDTPFRVHYTASAGALVGDGGFEKVLNVVDGLPALNKEKLFFTNHIKLFTDGAFFSQLMMVGPPGYLDGHEGEWLMVPETFEEAVRIFWHAGYKIHVHCTGDLGLELALDVLEKMQDEKPRFNHRFTIEHLGLSTPEQVRRMADLGAIASVNVYYLHELSAVYARDALGTERAHQMARLGTLKRHGIPFALHSDYTMAPAVPLNSVWVAATRLNVENEVVAPEEIISVEDSLRAITIDAAYVLCLENEVGTLRAVKRADFTILEDNPFECDPKDLRDIRLWGTLLGGKPFPIVKQ
jgi:predicted amidohydrolase YtcJ